MSKILIVGLPFFPKKYQYAVDAYRELGCEVKVLLNTGDEGKPEASKSQDLIEYAGKNNLIRMIIFIKVLIRFRPDNIDCYNYSILSLMYVLLSRAFGVNVRFWIIGGELVGDRQNSNSNSFLMKVYANVKKNLTWFCLKFTNAIFAKELHHVDAIKNKLPLAVKKIVQIHNCVPVPDFEPDTRRNLTLDFLYANAVIESRNVISLINSFHELQRENIKFRAAIYGFSSISNEVYAPRGFLYSEVALKHYKSLNLAKNVEVQGFVKDINQVMKQYRFFVFPSGVILANYALLEAMSYGLVPIVYPGNGYGKLVNDGVNGFVAFDNDLAKAFKRALSLSDEEYVNMSKLAYETISQNFSMQVWLKKLNSNLR